LEVQQRDSKEDEIQRRHTYSVRCAHLFLTLDVGVVVSQQHVPDHIFTQHQIYYSRNSYHKCVNGQWLYGSEYGHLSMIKKLTGIWQLRAITAVIMTCSTLEFNKRPLNITRKNKRNMQNGI